MYTIVESEVRMSGRLEHRLMRDLRRLQEEPPTGIIGGPAYDDFLLWNAFLFGPVGTLWEGGKFKLSPKFTAEYPNKLRLVHFVSPMFHPNEPLLYLCLQCLLLNPFPFSPANTKAAKMYRKNVLNVVAVSWGVDYFLLLSCLTNGS